MSKKAYAIKFSTYSFPQLINAMEIFSQTFQQSPTEPEIIPESIQFEDIINKRPKIKEHIFINASNKPEITPQLLKLQAKLYGTIGRKRVIDTLIKLTKELSPVRELFPPVYQNPMGNFRCPGFPQNSLFPHPLNMPPRGVFDPLISGNRLPLILQRNMQQQAMNQQMNSQIKNRNSQQDSQHQHDAISDLVTLFMSLNEIVMSS